MIKGEEAGAGPEEAAPTSAESECLASITHVHSHDFKRHVDDGKNIFCTLDGCSRYVLCTHNSLNIQWPQYCRGITLSKARAHVWMGRTSMIF